MMKSRKKTRVPWQLLLVGILMISVAATVPGMASGEPGYKFSYYANGRICVDELGKLDGKDPITVPPEQGWEDFKPSWSKTGDWLVFFRRVKNDRIVTNWKTVLCIIKSDGTDLRKLTDDQHTNFNPTWTRDGTNAPIWNRKHPRGHFFIMRSKIGNKPEQADVLTDKRYHSWVHSSLTDGRLLVESRHPTKGFGYYLMTPRAEGKSTFERIDDGGLLSKGLMTRISVSPDEKKICFGHIEGHRFKELGHAIRIADFDADKLRITNPITIANKDHNPGWYAYPRWTKDGRAVIYHANTTGKGKLYLYTLKDGKTKQVSTNDEIDFRYPHGEDTPK